MTALEDQELELYLGEDSPYKRHTAQVGTQMYMSPEQVGLSDSIYIYMLMDR